VDAGGQIHEFKFEESRKALSVALLLQGGEGRNMTPEKPQQVQEP
jgi:hypothetical protein